MSTRLERRVVAKTAAYTISPAKGDRCGTTFTNRGASGSVTFTLPTPSSALAGYWYQFRGVADQNIVVATATADTLITLNDAAADSVSAETSSQKIGAVIEAFCDGTSWFANVLSVGVTQTVTTA